MVPQALTIIMVVIIAVLLGRRPTVVLVACQSLVLLLPISVQQYYAPGIHPGALLIVAYFPVFSLARIGRRSSLGGALLPSVLLVCSVLALASSVGTAGALSTARILVELIVAPFAFIAVAWQTSRDSPNVPQVLRTTFVTLVVLNVVVAGFQQIVGRAYFFETINDAYFEWWNPSSTRRAGLVANPLDLGMLCAVATPLVAAVRRTNLRYVLVCVLAAGAALAQARTALVFVVAAAIFVCFADLRRLAQNFLGFVAILGGSVSFGVYSGLLSNISDRFSSQSLTDQYRFDAYSWWLSNIHSFLFLGYGPYRDPRDIGATTSSLENSYFVYAYDFGLAFSVLLVAVFAAFAWKVRGGSMHGTALAISAATFILVTASYSGIAATPYYSLVFAFSICSAKFVADDSTQKSNLQKRRKYSDVSRTPNSHITIKRVNGGHRALSTRSDTRKAWR